ncbi:polyphosphate kinase 2 family protein [Gordonia rubripertincta]|uniref:Polyphosphate kinase 2 family protein n=2 Tax=Gordonia rubripertincta TaxID=36822 RepID=A0AAW6R9E6_GORRU|nr:polyphosphate kinase 2 family protein [Gordonia rubripertincta]MDG6781096.1 polyphosphate kinase 2 family protein [Gordonia rubripertincta]NKY62419.1 polyphosphate kinase 2 family protein [Gordonia rubripertincta]GAB87334.1 putative phosphotransferase [Gordonia rubripertincta NBRC 101908]
MSKGWFTPAAEALRACAVGPIASFDPESTPGFDGDKESGSELLASRGQDLADLQELLYANGRSGDHRSVLLVLQGMDTAGKGGIVRHVGGLVDPQGLSIKGFGKPTPEELQHDFLWRIHKALPPAGRIGIFDRSHYEDVLPVRVHNLVPKAEWEKRYDLINQFESELVAGGTTIIKCCLVVSKDEQKARLAERLDRPDKYWKYNPGDIDERAHWDAYLEAYQDIFELTDKDSAPWFVIPANRKWFARLAVCELLTTTLAGLELDWPKADFDVEAEKKRLAASD